MPSKLTQIRVSIEVGEPEYGGETLSKVTQERTTPADLVDRGGDFLSELTEAVAQTEARVRDELFAQAELKRVQRENAKPSLVPDDDVA